MIWKLDFQRYRKMLNARTRAVSVVAGLALAISFVVAVQASVTGTVVDYRETDVGAEPYRSRMIVTPAFLRFDDGNDGSDFLLFDRKKKVIYNTNSMDKTILVIESQKIALPEKKDWTHRADTDNEKVPAIDGNEVKHWVLLTNNLVCYDLYASRNLLPDVTRALMEYHKVLSTQHAEIFLDMTGIQRDVCDLANNIYLPLRHLQHGFPISLRDKEGRMKQMLGYKTGVQIDDQVFRLPPGYREYRISDIRG